MNRPHDSIAERLDDDLEDLDGKALDVLARMQVRWRTSEGLRRIPREWDREDVRSKPHRVRRHAA